MKNVLIINGSGGVGKDTFVDQLKKILPTQHDSIVNPAKNLATYAGWNGEKTEAARRFLSDLKLAIDRYNDGSYAYVRANIELFLSEEDTHELLCIDMREKDQIDRAKRDFGAKTVLITRASVPHITSNIADAGVFNMEYDYTIANDGTIDDLYEKTVAFVNQLKADEGREAG